MTEDVGNFDWANEHDPIALSDYSSCPGEFGVYILYEDLGSDKEGEDRWRERYIGRGFGSTLKQRLSAHFNDSHNDKVKEYKDVLFYRIKEFATIEETRYVEAFEIASMNEEFKFNKRNEWLEHWALEI